MHGMGSCSWRTRCIVCSLQLHARRSCHICAVPLLAVRVSGWGCDCSAAQVRTDVRVVKEALGLEPCSNEAAEAAALKEVQQILQPHMGVTWPCGNPNNRT